MQGAPAPDADEVRRRQREVVDAFLAAARDGDFEALVDVLDPDVVARTEAGVTAGALAVAKGATSFAAVARIARPALVNGRTGLAVLIDGRVERTLAFTFVQERIAVIDIVTEHARVADSEVEIL